MRVGTALRASLRGAYIATVRKCGRASLREFEPACFDEPAGFKGYFSKTALEVRVFGRRFWFVEDATDSSGSVQR